MLIQMDGSIHNWFEGRRKPCWLILLIDDASNKVFMRFVEHESTECVMQVVREYIEKYGCPMSFYVDRDSIYKINSNQIQLALTETAPPITQFARAMKKLGIEMIFARSPQAKGRVERQFNTLQDRLPKELRLRNISTIEEANEFLDEYYIDYYSEKFGVIPLSQADLHVKLPDYVDLDSIFSIHNERKILRDYTFKFEKRIYQIQPTRKCVVIPNKKVAIEKWLDGTLHARYKDTYLEIEDVTHLERPKFSGKQKPKPVLKAEKYLKYPFIKPKSRYKGRYGPEKIIISAETLEKIIKKNSLTA